MATPNERMTSMLRVMAACLDGMNDEAFRMVYRDFEALRKEFPTLMTDDELREADAAYDNAYARNLPCGVQDAIAAHRSRVADEMLKRGIS